MLLVAVLVYAAVATARQAFRDPAQALARELQHCRAQALCGEPHTVPCADGGMTVPAARGWVAQHVDRDLRTNGGAWDRVLANLRAGDSLEDASPAARVLRVTVERGEDVRGALCLVRAALRYATRTLLLQPVNAAVAAVLLAASGVAIRRM